MRFGNFREDSDYVNGRSARYVCQVAAGFIVIYLIKVISTDTNVSALILAVWKTRLVALVNSKAVV